MALANAFAFRPSYTWLFSLVLAAFADACMAQELPKGWHVPPANLTGQDFRRKDPGRFLAATGDFNGDGIRDKAFLLVNNEGSKLGFFVCLMTLKGCDWHRLEEMDIGFLEVMGIATVKSGKYETACGKGYWDCGKNEPKTLGIKHAAIEFFKDESASSVYVYDPKKHAFTPIATSD